jgi:hypothetical protein
MTCHGTLGRRTNGDEIMKRHLLAASTNKRLLATEIAPIGVRL